MAFDQFGNFIWPQGTAPNGGITQQPQMIDGGSNPYTVNAGQPIDGGNNPFNVNGQPIAGQVGMDPNYSGSVGMNPYTDNGQPTSMDPNYSGSGKLGVNLKGGATTQPVIRNPAVSTANVAPSRTMAAPGTVAPSTVGQMGGSLAPVDPGSTTASLQSSTPYNFNSSGPEQQQAMSAYYDQTNGNYAQRQTTFNGLTTDADRVAYLKQNPDMLNQLNSQYGAGFKSWFDQSDQNTRGGMYDPASNTSYDVAGANGQLPTRGWQSTVNPAITQGQVASAQQMNGGGTGYTGATGAVNTPDPINVQQNASMAAAAGTPGSTTWNNTSQQAWTANQNGTQGPSSVPSSQPAPAISKGDTVSDPTSTTTTSNPYLNSGGSTQSQPNYYQPTQSAQNNIYGGAGNNTASSANSGAYQINPATYMKGWG